MRVSVLLAGLGCCAAATIWAIEPSPRESEPVATANGENLSDLPRPAQSAPSGESLVFPDMSAVKSPAESDNVLGVAAFANALKKPKDLDRAVELLERAVAADPENVAYKVDLADAYMFLGKDLAITAAVDLYEEVLDVEPDNDPVLGRLALAYLQLKNDDAAFAVLARRAAGKRADARGTALQLAATGLESGNLVRAVDETAKLVLRYPNEPFVRLVLAMLLSDTGRDADALGHVQKLIAELPAGSPLAAAAAELKERIGR